MKLYLILLLLAANTYVAVCDFDDYDDDAMDDIGDDTNDEVVEEMVAPKPKREQKYYVPPVARGHTFFTEHFESENVLETTWVRSKAKKDGVDADIAKYDGKWSIEEPDEQPLRGDLGLVLKSKAKHHAISAMLDKPYKFVGKPFVVQYEVKFQNAHDCGGAYVKLLSEDNKLKLTEITDKTPYTIMFGPDKCGNDAKLHFIFRHKNPKTGVFEEKHAKRPTVSIEKYFSDKKTHLYTLVVASDNSFEILIDNTVVNTGNLLEDVTPEVNPPEEIDDPNDKKPDEWDEKEKIRDPSAVKPDDWDESQPAKIPDETATKPEGWLDDELELIPDPEAVMPDDWDDEMDGEWEAPSIPNPKCDVGCGEWKPPMIDNPKHKGKWSAPLIDNPNYKGKWKPQRIKNPDYFYDDHPYKMTPISAIALELWSMSEGILFDNFIITDNKAVADQWATDSYFIKRGEEDVAAGAESVIQRLIATTDERPWLWAVYIIVIVLPVTLIIIYCCSSSPAKDAGTKKTDEASPDDIAEEEEEEGANDEAQEEADERGSGDAAESEAKSARKADLETEPAEEEAEVDEGKKSPRRRKPRKE